MKFILLAAFLVVSLQLTSAKIFTRCELAKALLAQKFARSSLENWVCLIESESSRNTKAKGGPNGNGTYDWGLFQLNDGIWCKKGVAGGDCKVSCENLLLDDITRACTCAKLVYARHGFSAWYGWKSKCQGTLPNLASECGI